MFKGSSVLSVGCTEFFKNNEGNYFECNKREGEKALLHRFVAGGAIGRYHTLNKNINYLHQYHFGGYAKHSNELIQFIREFFEVTGIKTDPIYSGKLFYALIDQLKKNSNSKKKVIALHSGGLSGIPGYEKRYKLKLFN